MDQQLVEYESLYVYIGISTSWFAAIVFLDDLGTERSYAVAAQIVTDHSQTFRSNVMAMSKSW